MEEKFALLYRKTSSLSLIEEQVERVTQKVRFFFCLFSFFKFKSTKMCNMPSSN